MAIHAAIHSVLWQTDLRGEHVVTTATEHNSVLRTLADLQERRGLRWTMVPCDARGWVDPDAIEQAICSDTKLVIVNHASNVTGVVQDLERIGRIVANSDAWWMLDAAQSLGYVDLDPKSLGVDLLVAPAHKGLGGMFGTAFVVASPEVLPYLRSPWVGGTGRSSGSWTGPFDWLESVQSGNINGPSIASLGAALRSASSRSMADFQATACDWLKRIRHQIAGYSSLCLVGYPDGPDDLEQASRVPVISFSSRSLGSHEMAMLLDSAMGIECRSGLHCAGAIHPFLGTDPHDGTLRMSFGHTTTEADVDAAIEGIRLLGEINA
jgi:selenocysteine lyase/cysteine desulfurase